MKTLIKLSNRKNAFEIDSNDESIDSTLDELLNLYLHGQNKTAEPLYEQIQSNLSEHMKNDIKDYAAEYAMDYPREVQSALSGFCKDLIRKMPYIEADQEIIDLANEVDNSEETIEEEPELESTVEESSIEQPTSEKSRADINDDPEVKDIIIRKYLDSEDNLTNIIGVINALNDEPDLRIDDSNNIKETLTGIFANKGQVNPAKANRYINRLLDLLSPIIDNDAVSSLIKNWYLEANNNGTIKSKENISPEPKLEGERIQPGQATQEPVEQEPVNEIDESDLDTDIAGEAGTNSDTDSIDNTTDEVIDAAEEAEKQVEQIVNKPGEDTQSDVPVNDVDLNELDETIPNTVEEPVNENIEAVNNTEPIAEPISNVENETPVSDSPTQEVSSQAPLSDIDTEDLNTTPELEEQQPITISPNTNEDDVKLVTLDDGSMGCIVNGVTYKLTPIVETPENENPIEEPTIDTNSEDDLLTLKMNNSKRRKFKQHLINLNLASEEEANLVDQEVFGGNLKGEELSNGNFLVYAPNLANTLRKNPMYAKYVKNDNSVVLSRDMFDTTTDSQLVTNKVIFYKLPVELYDAINKHGFNYQNYGISYEDLLMLMPENKIGNVYNPKYYVAKRKVSDGLKRWREETSDKLLQRVTLDAPIRQAIMSGWKWNREFGRNDLNPESPNYANVINAANAYLSTIQGSRQKLAMFKNACICFGNAEGFNLGIPLLKLSNTLDENNNRKFRF
jgi:hypothetical protein